MEPRRRDIRGSSALIRHVSEIEIAGLIIQGVGQFSAAADSMLISQAVSRLTANQAADVYFAGSHQNGVRLRIAAASVPSSR